MLATRVPRATRRDQVFGLASDMTTIAFFGLPLAACLLAEDGHDLGIAVLSPVDAPGRRRAIRRLPRVLDARAAGFDAEVDRALRDLRPDLLVSWFWTRKLPERWIASARLGGIGAHPSL